MAAGTSLHVDARRILAAQALRALAYGFGSVHLGIVLTARGWSSTRIGVLLAAVVTGIAITSLLLGRFAERIGRRRSYAILYAALAAVGVGLAFTDRLWILVPLVLTGALSTEVVESGPFTSLEQAMLAHGVEVPKLARGFSLYNASATMAGSLGAFLAGGPKLLQDQLPGPPTDSRLFLLFVPAAVLGAVIALRLSPAVEIATGSSRQRLVRSRPTVLRLSGLFAIDAFAGGFVIQTFVVVHLQREFGASAATLGWVFASIGILQTISFLLAHRIAARIGLLATMVATHIPSNLCLVGVAFASNMEIAIALLCLRGLLGQMDVPTRQAYVMALVDPEERVAAASTTNVARYIGRPVAALSSGVVLGLGAGAPFVVAGVLKTAYDLMLWRWFRRVPLADDEL